MFEYGFLFVFFFYDKKLIGYLVNLEEFFM